jgi:hypothetical protein
MEMTHDERAEAARLRWLGCDAADAVPWAELKQCVRDRWLGVLEAVAPADNEIRVIGNGQPFTVTHNGVPLVPALRVPFSDEQIERMAKAARDGFYGEAAHCNWDECTLKDDWHNGIRAALAAGGLEPCAVPEYEPADVALRPAPTDADVEALAQIIRAEYEGPKRYEWQYSAYKDEWRAAARAAFAHIGAVPVGCPECAARREHMMKPQPVIECAMCAEWEKDCRALSTASRNIDARIAARAALEGDA